MSTSVLQPAGTVNGGQLTTISVEQRVPVEGNTIACTMFRASVEGRTSTLQVERWWPLPDYWHCTFEFSYNTGGTRLVRHTRWRITRSESSYAEEVQTLCMRVVTQLQYVYDSHGIRLFALAVSRKLVEISSVRIGCHLAGDVGMSSFDIRSRVT